MSATQKLMPRAGLWAEPRVFVDTISMKPTASHTMRPPLPLGVMLGTLPHPALSMTPPESTPVSMPAVKSWQPAAAIAQDKTLRSTIPSVAVDERGHAFAVWVHSDGATDSIWFNRYVPGAGWDAADMVRTGLTGKASDPQVAIDDNGDALVVWSQFDGRRRTIWVSRLVAGLAWGEPVQIAADRFTDADSPRVATDSKGGAMVVWRQFDGSVSRNIWASRYVPEHGWCRAELVGREGSGTAFDPQIALDPYGNAFVLWAIPGGKQGCVWTNRYVVGRGWGSPAALHAGNGGDVVDPRLVCNGYGHAVAVWCQRLGTHYGVWASRYSPAFGWGESERVGVDLSSSAAAPQVALNVRGEAIVVWDQSDGASGGIWANRFVPGRGWTMAMPVTGSVEGDASAPQVAIDDRGDAVALWIQSSGTHFGIKTSRFSRGRGWDFPSMVKNGNAETLGVPQVAMDASGNAVAAWMQSEPSGFAILASVFR